jgi:alkanesulfonate monooxygenase SsuD/methylene tetrahydromethanopterin reductase-like flavin-dependent oxidoreductase (luciferase family)
MELRIFCEPQQGASYDELLELALAAEAGGFGAFIRSDHYLKMGPVSGLPGPSDAWITLAGLARDTTTIRLGTLLTAATFRLPGPLAISVANVDAMSKGRIELGLGAGWFDEEHTAYGIPFPSVGQRFEKLEEQLAIITGLWTTDVGSTFDFVGKHYQLAKSPALPSRRSRRIPRSSSVVTASSARRDSRRSLLTSSTSPLPCLRTAKLSSCASTTRVERLIATLLR